VSGAYTPRSGIGESRIPQHRGYHPDLAMQPCEDLGGVGGRGGEGRRGVSGG
jgi:hypothetical protein